MSKLSAQVTRKGLNVNDKETLGTMLIFNELEQPIMQLCTLELPWKSNKKEVSCIPVGEYTVVKAPKSSNIPYPHFSITGVTGRDGVCIHKANYVRQLKGCIAVGLDENDIDGDGLMDITSSGIAFDKLFALMPDSFILTIK